MNKPNTKQTEEWKIEESFTEKQFAILENIAQAQREKIKSEVVEIVEGMAVDGFTPGGFTINETLENVLEKIKKIK